MSNTIRTVDGCLAEAPDNTLRLISPQDYRDFVLSAFGAFLPFDPTPQDDSSNTAGNGFFDRNSVWLNSDGVNKAVWVCFSGAHNAADWRKVWPQAAPFPEHIRGTVAVVAGPVTSLSGLCPVGIGFYPSGTIVLTSLAGFPETIGAYVTGGPSWPRVAWWPDGQVNQEPMFVWVEFNGADFMDGLPYMLYIRKPNPTPFLPDVAWTVGVDVPDVLQWVENAVFGVPVEFEEHTLGCKIQTLGVSGGLHWQNQVANTVFAGPTSGSPFTPAFRALVAADIPPITLPDVAAGTNVTVSVSGLTYTVSVPTFPYANLTGTPAVVDVVAGTGITVVQSPTGTFTVSASGGSTSVVAGTNVTVTGPVSGAYTVSVPTFPAASITGTLPASQVGPGYPFGSLTGAPTAFSQRGTLTTSAGPGFATIFSATATNGLMGTLRLMGQIGGAGGNAYDWQIIATDPRNGAQTYQNLGGTSDNSGSIGFIVNLDTSSEGFLGTARINNNPAPITAIQVLVRTHVGFGNANLDLTAIGLAL